LDVQGLYIREKWHVALAGWPFFYAEGVFGAGNSTLLHARSAEAGSLGHKDWPREWLPRLRLGGLEIVREKAELNPETAKVTQIYQRLHSSGSRQPPAFFVRLAVRAVLCGLVVRNFLRFTFDGPLGAEV